jgi:ABC-type multidrug transport system ATPase subunit
MQSAISIQNLSKHYADNQALKSINCEIQPGELFGFIGPDGAGKTSLFRILTSLLLPDQGQAKVLGFDVVSDYKAIREQVGYMPGRFSLYQDLTVEENLKFFAGVFKSNLAENYYLIEDIYQQILPFKHRRAGKLSGGMKQKLALSCALIHKPQVLLLDEPSTGVDAVSRKELWEMLHKLKMEGITILVSTPYMDEAAKCDRVALMQKGKILSIDTPTNIIKAFPHTLGAVKSPLMNPLLQVLKQSKLIHSAYLFGENIHVVCKLGIDFVQLEQELISKGVVEWQYQIINAGIEDCFMELMNK